jgi:hypothetical protein
VLVDLVVAALEVCQLMELLDHLTQEAAAVAVEMEYILVDLVVQV